LALHLGVGVCVDERGFRVSVPEPLGEQGQGHAGLVEVHGPRVAEHVRVDPVRDVGAPGLGGGGVLADEPGDVVVGHLCRAMISHGVEQRCFRFRAGVEDGGVAVEVPGRLAGDGQAPGLGAFAEQVRGEPPGVDAGEVQGEHLGVAGGEVIHEDHEELVAQPDPGAGVWGGEQRRDRVRGHVLDRCRGRAVEPGDGGEVGEVDGERRLGGGRVGEERPDAGEALVAGRGRP
jgi:hypothetical protein